MPNMMTNCRGQNSFQLRLALITTIQSHALKERLAMTRRYIFDILKVLSMFLAREHL
jgi:hypothetical protein